MDKAVAELSKAIEDMGVFLGATVGLLSDLVDLQNPDVDKLLSKYEVTFEGKFPRPNKQLLKPREV